MSGGTGSRVASQYRRLATENLRQAAGMIRNQRRKAAIDLVLTERQEAYQAGYDAAQIVLDAIGGPDAPDLQRRATATAERQSRAFQHLEAEYSHGVADALHDYIRDRADT